MDEPESELAVMWERSEVVRSRFRANKSWLQWPYILEPEPKDGSDEENKVEKHPVNTKSLELNVEPLHSMLMFYSGKFIEIPELQHEAFNHGLKYVSPGVPQWKGIYLSFKKTHNSDSVMLTYGRFTNAPS